MEEKEGGGGRLLVLVLLAQVVVQVGFGANGVVLKLFAQASDVHPLLFSFLRDMCAAPVLLFVAWIVEGKQRSLHSRRAVHCLGRNLSWPSTLSEVLLFAALGLTGMFLNQFLFIQGVYLTNATIAAIFQPAIPVFTVVLSMALGTEELPSRRAWHGWAKLLGISCAVGGAVVMLATAAPSNAGEEGREEEEEEWAAWNLMLGNLSLLGNTMGMALYVVIQKRFVFYRVEEKGKRNNGVREENNCDEEFLVRFWKRYTGVVRTVERGEGEEGGASLPESVLEDASVGLQLELKEETYSRATENGMEGDDKATESIEMHIENNESVSEENIEEGNERETVALFHRWAHVPLTVTSWSYVSGTVFMGAASLLLLLLEPQTIEGVNNGIWLPLAYAVLISSTLCYGLVSWGNKHLSSTVITGFWPLQVFVAVTLGYLLLGERIGILQATGGAAILSGLLIVTVTEKLQRDDASEERSAGEVKKSINAEMALMEEKSPWESEEVSMDALETAETVAPPDGTSALPELRRKSSQ